MEVEIAHTEYARFLLPSRPLLFLLADPYRPAPLRLPHHTRPHMLVFCVRCKRVARMVWEPERGGAVWISEKEKEGTGWK